MAWYSSFENLVRAIFSDDFSNTILGWSTSWGVLSIGFGALNAIVAFVLDYFKLRKRVSVAEAKRIEYERKYAEYCKEKVILEEYYKKITQVTDYGGFVFVNSHRHPRIPICQKCWYESKNQVELVFNNKYTVNLSTSAKTVIGLYFKCLVCGNNGSLEGADALSDLQQEAERVLNEE